MTKELLEGLDDIHERWHKLREDKECEDEEEWNDLLAEIFQDAILSEEEQKTCLTPERELVMAIVRDKHSGAGADGLHFLFWYITRWWSAGFFAAFIQALADGSWEEEKVREI